MCTRNNYTSNNEKNRKKKKIKELKKYLPECISKEEIENNLEIISKKSLEKLFILSSEEEIKKIFNVLETLKDKDDEKRYFLLKILEKKELESLNNLDKLINEI